MNREKRQAREAEKTGFAIILLASTLLMGSSFVAGKILIAAGFPAILLVGWRFFVAALATLPLVLLEGRPRAALFPPQAGLKDGALVVVIGLLQTGAVMGLLFAAMRTVSASTAAILIFTNPIWVALLGRVFLAEALTRARIAGLVLGFVGVVLAIGGKGGAGLQSPMSGELLGLLSSFCWAIATVINKRANLPLGPWAVSFWQMLVGSSVLIGVAYALGEEWPVSSVSDWGWFLWLAIPASTGSFGLWFIALRMGGATRTSGYLFLTPLFTVILSFFVLGADLSWVQAAGGMLIGLALWLVNRAAPFRTRREASAAAAAEGQP